MVNWSRLRVEPLGGPEFRTNGVLAPWHNL